MKRTQVSLDRRQYGKGILYILIWMLLCWTGPSFGDNGVHWDFSEPDQQLSLELSTLFNNSDTPMNPDDLDLSVDYGDGVYSGEITAYFNDPIPNSVNPNNPAVTGVGTSQIKWGDPFPNSFSSNLVFYGTTFEGVDKGEDFLAGILLFGNGTIYTDSGIDGITLNIDAQMFTPDPVTFAADPIESEILNSPNVYGDPIASADIVSLPTIGNLHTFEETYAAVAVYGQIGSLHILGMDPIAIGDGYVTFGDPASPVPAPGSLALLGIGIGLVHSVKRRFARESLG